MASRLLLAAALLAAAACPDPAADASQSAVETPERQFVFEGVQIEERRGEHVLWSGHARRADGDLNAADVEDVVLDYVTEEKTPRTLRVSSPRAKLALDDGKAIFDDVRIVDENGGVLEAGTAHYDERADTLVADGPIAFAAQGLEATATHGVVHIGDGTVDIEGPIRGRFVRPETPTPSAP